MTELGRCQRNMWQDEALCSGLNTENYFNNYEDNPELAVQIDLMCINCPVIRECFKYGVSTESWGVWGRVYLVDGKIDSMKNSHKTQEVWSRILGEMS